MSTINLINLDPKTLEWLSNQAEEKAASEGNVRSMVFEQCTDEQFLDYKERQKAQFKIDKTPTRPCIIEVQGMKGTRRLPDVVRPAQFAKTMKLVWGKVYSKYPPAAFDIYTVDSEEHGTPVVKVVIMPKMPDECKEEHTKVALGYRDFDQVDRDFDIIQNCESSKFSPETIFGLSIDNSRNEVEEDDSTIGEEEELMANLGMTYIPEDTDGFLRQMVNSRDDLRSEVVSKAPTW